MRSAAVVFCALAAASAAPAQPDEGGPRWMVGCWSGQQGRDTYDERWISPADDLLLGVSHTVRDGRVVAFEFLRIESREREHVYVAQPGGRAPTEFVAPRGAGREIVFENPAHDFPKRVGYSSARADELTAWIDGGPGTQRIVYAMRRVTCEPENVLPADDGTAGTVGLQSEAKAAL